MDNPTESRKQQLLNRSLLIAGLLFIVFFIYVIYAANQGSLPLFIRRVYMFPGGDKVGHIVLLALLTFFSNWLFRLRIIYVSQFHLLVGSILILFFITFEEFSQFFLASRTFDFADLLFSYFGILLGDASARFVGRRNKFGNHNNHTTLEVKE